MKLLTLIKNTVGDGRVRREHTSEIGKTTKSLLPLKTIRQNYLIYPFKSNTFDYVRHHEIASAWLRLSLCYFDYSES